MSRSIEVGIDERVRHITLLDDWFYGAALFQWLEGRTPLNGYTVYMDNGRVWYEHLRVEEHTVIHTMDHMKFYTVPPCSF